MYKTVMAALLLLCVAASAFAQPEMGDRSDGAGPELGDLRIGLSAGAVLFGRGEIGGVDIDSTAVDFGTTDGGIRFGAVMTNGLEGGIDFSLSYLNVDSGGADNDVTEFSVGPYLAMNIPVSSEGMFFSPWVGIGYTGSDDDNVEIRLFSISLGLETKWFVGDDASVDAGLVLAYADGETEVGGRDFDTSQFVFGPHIGISIWP